MSAAATPARKFPVGTTLDQSPAFAEARAEIWTGHAIRNERPIVVTIFPATPDGYHWVRVADLRMGEETCPKRPVPSDVIGPALERLCDVDIDELTWRLEADGVEPSSVHPFEPGAPAVPLRPAPPKAQPAPKSKKPLPAVGVVYFIQGVDGGPVKIGTTRASIEERLSGLQTGSPVLLRVLAITAGGLRMERELHERFAALSLHGEWFRPEPELLAFIDSLKERT